MMDLNGLYATHRNVTHRHTGSLWQGRFYSAVLDTAHWATALQYTELNPVRARMVAQAEDWEWSSARAHLSLAPGPAWLNKREFAQNWPSAEDWRERLGTLTRQAAAFARRSFWSSWNENMVSHCGQSIWAVRASLRKQKYLLTAAASA